jgi:hypothetical protein
MPTDSKFVEQRAASIEQQLETLPGILAHVYAKKDFRRIGYVVESMNRILLQRGMMTARILGDFARARADFARAASLTVELDRALELIREGTDTPAPNGASFCLDAHSLELPVFACLLAEDWTRVEVVARMALDLHAVDMLEDQVGVLMTRLLAAFVLDERTVFAALRVPYNRIAKSMWWKYFAHYVDMYESVLERDQARYTDLAASADKFYRARARNRTIGDLRPEYGGLAENERMLDFIALAIAIVAVKRGMSPGKESDIVPSQLISHL